MRECGNALRAAPLPVRPKNATTVLSCNAATYAALQQHNRSPIATLGKRHRQVGIARGGGELTSLLTHEHVIIGPLARRVRGIAARILEDGIDADRWAEFQSAATDLVAEMMAHLQKEELTVVQRLRTFRYAPITA